MRPILQEIDGLDSSSVGARLKKVRTDLGLSQKKMAEHLKITSAYWSAIETGVRQVTLSIILTLRNDFKISVDWLLTGLGDQRIQNSGKQSQAQESTINSSIQDTEDSILFVRAQLLSVIDILNARFEFKPDKKVIDLVDSSISSIPYIDLTTSSFEEKKNHLDKVEAIERHLFSEFWKLFSELYIRERGRPRLP